MKLRFPLLLALVCGFMFSACDKAASGCKNLSPAEEETTLLNFISSKGFTGTKHSSGLYYQILNPGGSLKPTVRNQVFVSYKLSRFDGTVIESVSNPGTTGFGLGSLVQAWQIGVPLVGKGGSIRLFCPSSLAYGCTGSGANIPANTPLFFEITLVDFL